MSFIATKANLSLRFSIPAIFPYGAIFRGEIMQKNNDYLKKTGRGFGRLGEWIFDHRWTVVIFYVFLIAISLYFAGKLHKDNSFDSYFDKNDPTFTYYKNYQKSFGSDE